MRNVVKIHYGGTCVCASINRSDVRHADDVLHAIFTQLIS